MTDSTIELAPELNDEKVIDFADEKLFRTLDKLNTQYFLPYTENLYGTDKISDIADDFLDFASTTLDQNVKQDLFGFVFVPWFVLNRPCDDIDFSNETQKQKTIAQLCLEENESEFSEYESNLIRACCESYLSFYRIIQTDQEAHTMVLKDIFLGNVRTVKLDGSIPVDLPRGFILCARLASFNDETLLIAPIPMIFPTYFYTAVMDYREDFEKMVDVPLSPELLRNKFAAQISSAQVDLIECAINEETGFLDEAIPDELLEGIDKEGISELLESIMSDEDGGMDPEALNKLLSLADEDDFDEDLMIETTDDLEELSEDEELDEAKNYVENVLNDHDVFLNKPFPELDDLTPLEAVKTERGKEQLNVLLIGFENLAQLGALNVIESLEALREKLGLAEYV